MKNFLQVNRASTGAKTNLNFKWLWTDSHEKQSPQRFVRYAAMLIMLLTLGVGQMWATDYYYRGEKNSWGAAKMLVSSDGFYSYYSASAGAHKFKVSTSTDGWDYDKTKEDVGFNGTGTNLGTYGDEDNCYCWESGAHYIIIYHPNTAINTTSNPKICAATFLPSGGLYLAGDDSWLDPDWNTTANDTKMSRVGSTAVYSFTVSDVSAGDNTHKFKVSNYNWGASWGYSDYLADSHPNIVGSITNDNGDIVFKAAMEGDVTIKFNTSTKKVSIVCQAPTITFDKEGGSGGPDSQNTYYNEATSSITAPTKSYHDFGGYWTGDDGTGTEVINSSGAWKKDISNFTDNSATAKWVVRDDYTLHAKWTPKNYSITYKDEGNVAYSGSNEASLPTSYTYGTGIATLTDGVKSGYRFDGWFTESTCSGDPVTSISSSANGDKTFYAKWTENPGGTVTLTAGTGGQVSKNGSSWGSSTSYTGIKSTTPLNIYAQANTGYTFSAWSKTSGSGEITDTDDASTTFTPVADADAALAASFTENTVTVSPTCAYDAGDPEYSNPTATNSGTVGIASTSTLVAPVAGTGYTFAGWTLSSNIVVASGTPSTDRTITIRTNGDGNAVTATANYNEVLTTGWYLAGEFSNGGNTDAGWGVGKIEFMKPSGASTGNVAYATLDLDPATFASDGYDMSFKITDGGSNWLGNNGTYDKSNNNQQWRFKGEEDDCKLDVSVEGTYTFRLQMDTTMDTYDHQKAIRITYPNVNKLNISDASPTDATNTGNFDLSDPVSNVRSVKRSLNANTTYTFKIVYNSDWYGYTSGTFTRSTYNSSNTLTTNTSGGNMTLTTDYAGDYTFKFNESTKALFIEFPEAYKVTYEKGTVDGSSGTCSAVDLDNGSAAVTSNSTWVKSGNRVVLTAPAAKDGYTYDGWFDNNSGTGDAITTNANCTITVTSALTRYACYHENDYTVTVQSNDATNAGTVASSSVTGHKDTKVPLPAVSAKPGYYFKNWTVVTGSASFDDATSATAKVYDMTDDCTVQANFVPIWRVAGGDLPVSANADGMGEWSTEANKITTLTITDGVMTSGTVTVTLAANTEYDFKVFNAQTNKYWGYSGDVTKITYEYQATAQALTNDAGNNQTFRSAAAGTYTFTWDVEHSKVSITYPTSHKITYGGYKTVYLEGADGTTDGGTMRAVVSEVTINSGDYVSDGVTVNFYADETDGYHPDGWYNNSDYADAHRYKRTDPNVYLSSDESLLQLTSVSEDKTLYLKYKENKLTLYVSPFLASVEVYDVGGSVVKETIDGLEPIYVGVHTGKKLKVIPDVPYYFTGWELAETPIYNIYKTDGSGAAPAENEDYAEVNVYATSECTSDVATQTLYANCRILNAIYFRNEKEDHTALWDSVYVGFDATWSTTSAGDKGGVKGASTKGKTVLPMENIHDNIWRVYIPRDITRAEYHNVAFFDKGEMRGWNEFYGNNGVYRTDFDVNNNGILNMYVPYHVKSTTDNTTTYYSTGYWKTAFTNSENAGYYLEHRYDNNRYSRIGTFVGTSDNKISYTLRLDNKDYKDYVIYDANNQKHVAVSGITSANYTDIRVNMDNTSDSKFGLTPTAEGNYIFVIDQSCDTMKLSVEFPVAVNDYVIENVYNDGSSKTTRTNVIKAADAATKTRYSMFISNEGASPTLKLRKCTSIDVYGVPQWSDGDDTNLSGILSAEGFKPGVYQFDLTIDKSTDKVSEVDSLRLYTGNFYIKTDAADGGWVHYKRNILEKNSVNFDRTSATYDNYFCKYFESMDCNIKSVIANDYCNQLSDTVKGDGIARMVGPEPFVPVDGTSIRFSYNSATNETKRAYLGASEKNDFLNIYPSTDNKIYRTVDAIEYDLYDIRTSDKGKCKFADNGNWVYEMDLSVKPGGKAGVTATYTDAEKDVHVQNLVPDTNTVLGGSSSNLYAIRIVYDFKTNFMMSSFVLDGETTINEDLSDFDMLWVRHKDESATQLTLGSGNKLTNVRPIGAIEFRYDSLHRDASHTGGWVDLSSTNTGGWKNPLARPYLKYFVSFPFDVEVNSIFGLNQARYGRYDHYVIQKYDGATRAKEGLFYGDGDNYWVDLQPGDTMKANEGYCVIFDNEYVEGSWGSMWENKGTGSRVYMYFPAIKEVASITNSDEVMKVDSLKCHVNRTFRVGDKEKNHMNTDSHWHLIGNPLFHDAFIKDFTNGDADSTLHSYYYMDLTSPTNQDWKSRAIEKGTTPFKAMSSVLVQWFGTINWSKDAGVAAAPKRRTNEDKNYLAQLDIWYNGVNADQAFVRLEDGANEGFKLCEDMSKVLVKSRPNIYTFTGDYDVAYNEMPVANCTIPVGLVARKNGTYTFSMPSNFSGTVTLIDTYAQTRTNLNIEDYEVTLNKGTIDDRFLLEIDIYNAPTAIDGASDGQGTLKDGKAHKFIMNDQMYILKDGVIYDARGSRVK